MMRCLGTASRRRACRFCKSRSRPGRWPAPSASYWAHELIVLCMQPAAPARVAAGNAADLVLGHYRILERLGSGGTSVVYKAEQLALRREVAIKVLSAPSTSNPRGASRFTAEVRAVARLQHPNIVAAIDAGV